MKIKLLVMDVDGTLTDGSIYMGTSGELMKAFNVKDGYAIAHLLPQAGIVPVIITGRSSEIVSRRARELNISDLYQGVSQKLDALTEIASHYHAAPSEIAYIGDDLNDLTCIQYCGLTGCPNDAVSEIKACVKYICHCNGGQGAVREFITYILEQDGFQD